MHTGAKGLKPSRKLYDLVDDVFIWAAGSASMERLPRALVRTPSVPGDGNHTLFHQAAVRASRFSGVSYHP